MSQATAGPFTGTMHGPEAGILEPRLTEVGLIAVRIDRRRVAQGEEAAAAGARGRRRPQCSSSSRCCSSSSPAHPRRRRSPDRESAVDHHRAAARSAGGGKRNGREAEDAEEIGGEGARRRANHDGAPVPVWAGGSADLGSARPRATHVPPRRQVRSAARESAVLAQQRTTPLHRLHPVGDVNRRRRGRAQERAERDAPGLRPQRPERKKPADACPGDGLGLAPVDEGREVLPHDGPESRTSASIERAASAPPPRPAGATRISGRTTCSWRRPSPARRRSTPSPLRGNNPTRPPRPRRRPSSSTHEAGSADETRSAPESRGARAPWASRDRARTRPPSGSGADASGGRECRRRASRAAMSASAQSLRNRRARPRLHERAALLDVAVEQSPRRLPDRVLHEPQHAGPSRRPFMPSAIPAQRGNRRCRGAG